jgi:hypothetical protein
MARKVIKYLMEKIISTDKKGFRVIQQKIA